MCDGQPWTMPPIGSKRPQQKQPETRTSVAIPTDKERNEQFFAVLIVNEAKRTRKYE